MSEYLISRENAAAVLVDVQTKMMPAVHDGNALEQRIVKAVQILRLLNVPILVTQHYTRGLGETTQAVAEALGSFSPVEKITFSCMHTPEFAETLKKLNRKSVILFGVETHVCIQQTALMMKERGYHVFLPVDLTESRFPLDRETALKRMYQSGITLTTSESLYFELMQSAKHPHFKEISKIIK